MTLLVSVGLGRSIHLGNMNYKLESFQLSDSTVTKSLVYRGDVPKGCHLEKRY